MEFMDSIKGGYTQFTDFCNINDAQDDSDVLDSFHGILGRDYYKSRGLSWKEESSLHGNLKEEDGLVVSMTSARNIVPRALCKAVILRLHPNLRKSLNFKEIWPYLNKRQLLDSESQALFGDPAHNSQAKVDYLLTKLLEYNHEDFLTPFIESLKESEPEAGRAHSELIEDIFQLLKSEDRKSKDKNDPKKRVVIHILVVCKVLALLLILSTAILVSIFSRPPVPVAQPKLIDVYGSNITIGLHVSHLYSSVVAKWNMSRSRSTCTASVYHLHGPICTDPRLFSHQHVTDSYFRDSTRPIYMEASSTIVANYSNASLARGKKLFLRLTKSLQEYDKYLNLDGIRQDRTCKPPTCYSSEPLPLPLTFKINESDFYYLYLYDEHSQIQTPSYIGIEYHFDAIYLNQVIVDYANNHSITPVDIDFSTSGSLKTAEFFHFGQSYCNFLQYFCGPTGTYFTLIIDHGVPRIDIIVLILLIFFALIGPLIIILALLFKRLHKLKACHV